MFFTTAAEGERVTAQQQVRRHLSTRPNPAGHLAIPGSDPVLTGFKCNVWNTLKIYIWAKISTLSLVGRLWKLIASTCLVFRSMDLLLRSIRGSREAGGCRSFCKTTIVISKFATQGALFWPLVFDPSGRSHVHWDVSRTPHVDGAHVAPTSLPQRQGRRLAQGKQCFVHLLQPLQAAVSLKQLSDS